MILPACNQLRMHESQKKQVAFWQLLLNEHGDDDDKYRCRQLLHRNEMHTCYVTRHIQAAAWWTPSSAVASFHKSSAVIHDWTYLLRDNVFTRSISVFHRSVMVSRHVVCLWKNAIRMCNKKRIFSTLMIGENDHVYMAEYRYITHRNHFGLLWFFSLRV